MYLVVVPKAEAVRAALGRVWRLWTGPSRAWGPGPSPASGLAVVWQVPSGWGSAPSGPAASSAGPCPVCPPSRWLGLPTARLQLMPPSSRYLWGCSGAQTPAAPVAFRCLPWSQCPDGLGTSGALGPTRVRGERPRAVWDPRCLLNRKGHGRDGSPCQGYLNPRFPLLLFLGPLLLLKQSSG